MLKKCFIETFRRLKTPLTLIRGLSISSSSSIKSLTPHLGFCIISTVSESSSPVTFRPANSWNFSIAVSSLCSDPTLPLNKKNQANHWKILKYFPCFPHVSVLLQIFLCQVNIWISFKWGWWSEKTFYWIKNHKKYTFI